MEGNAGKGAIVSKKENTTIRPGLCKQRISARPGVVHVHEEEKRGRAKAPPVADKGEATATIEDRGKEKNHPCF